MANKSHQSNLITLNYKTVESSKYWHLTNNYSDKNVLLTWACNSNKFTVKFSSVTTWLSLQAHTISSIPMLNTRCDLYEADEHVTLLYKT